MAQKAIDLDTKALKQFVANGQKLGILAAGRLKAAMVDTVFEVERRAKERSPVKEGHLRSGIRGEVKVAGPLGLVGNIVAGGLAAAYAEVQHEREDFAHTLEELAAKGGLSIASSLKTKKTFALGKRGKRRKIKGYKGGQSHYLYGKHNSAWNPYTRKKHEARIDAVLQKTGTEAFE